MGAVFLIGLVLLSIAFIVSVIAVVCYGMYMSVGSLFRLWRRLWIKHVSLGARAAAGESRALAGQVSSIRPAECQFEQACWEMKQCPECKKQACSAYKRQDVPCWLARLQADEKAPLMTECLTCKLFNLPALVS